MNQGAAQAPFCLHVWDVHQRWGTQPEVWRYQLGIPAAEGSIQSHMPTRHSPSIEQCSGPCHAICPRARGSRDRWASHHAREVSSSAGCGLCYNPPASALATSSDIQRLIGTAAS